MDRPFFLRTPDFPWVDAGLVTISVPPSEMMAAPSRAEADDAICAIRSGRVGGAFWARAADPWIAETDRTPIVADDVDDEDVLIAWLSGRPIIDATGEPIADAVLRDALIDALVHAAYRDPFRDAPSSIGDSVALLADWRRSIDANRAIVATTGISHWKREAIGRFCWNGSTTPPALSPRDAIDRARKAGGAIGYWPSQVPAGFVATANRAGARTSCIEDGFLRSSGLGADLRPPCSVAIDSRGIYFDPAKPSDLDVLLSETVFDAGLLARGAALRARICALRVGKYGIESGDAAPLPVDRRTILAVGQVDDDLSVRLGGAGIAGNAAFLERVRAEEPNAYIVYRPHPDVLAGHRRGHVADGDALRFVDRVDPGSGLLSLVERVDAVHVLSSLTGFEALLREREVVVHGQPFFAGWGLTRDLAEQPAWRGRALSLDALVIGALILYPRYLDPVTGLPCTAEILVERIAAGAAGGNSWLTILRRAQGRLRRGLTLAREALA